MEVLSPDALDVLRRPLLGGSGTFPSLVPGTEDLGEDRTGAPGFGLLRRVDGTVVRLSPLTYALARALDGWTSPNEVAAAVGVTVDRPVSEGNVAHLIEHKLVPLGLVAGRTGQPRSAPPGVLSSLTWRSPVVPARLVGAVARGLAPLFRLPAVATVLGALVALDVWVLGSGRLVPAWHSVLQRPSLTVPVLAVVIAAAAFHELGHAAACRYGGAEPGAIGIGIYLVWPVFYNDLTDTYRLDRRGRLRADLGGIYFHAVFILAIGATYLFTGWQPLVVMMAMCHLEAVEQLLPFVCLDGSYVVADAAGVPDLFGRIRSVLSGLRPGRRAEPWLADLDTRTRVVVVTWAVLTVVFLAGVSVLTVVTGPELVAAWWSSVVANAGELVRSAARGAGWTAAASAGELVGLAVPAVGTAAVAARRLRPNHPRNPRKYP